MKQSTIDLYNKGQNDYTINDIIRDDAGDCWYIYFKDEEYLTPSIYEFLFNPEYGAVKAIVGEEEQTRCQDTGEIQYQIEDGKFRGMQNYKTINIPLWKHILQQMAIAPDALAYLENYLEGR